MCVWGGGVKIGHLYPLSYEAANLQQGAKQFTNYKKKPRLGFFEFLVFLPFHCFFFLYCLMNLLLFWKFCHF